jgi:hypothetical protein
MSGHARKRFRQISKALSKGFPGQVRVERVDRFQNLTDLGRTLAVVDEIAKTTWQRTMAGGLQMNASQLEALKKQAERGWLRVHIVYLADKPSAFSIGALYRRTFYSEYIGYNPDYASYALGTYLLSQMMEEFCSEGVEAIDFGSSDEEYKIRFGNVVSHETDLHLFAPSLTGLRLSAMNTITILLREPTKAFLKRLNLIQRTKKVWRRVRIRRAKANEARGGIQE